MQTTLVKLDISVNNNINDTFLGSIFRGWLGFILKCNPLKNCNGCNDTATCPYFMVFKEPNQIKPYSLLAFKTKNEVTCFIKLFGDRRVFAPKILANITEKETDTHFGGKKFKIKTIEAKKIDIENIKLTDKTRIATISPLHIIQNRRQEIIPSLNSVIRSSVRAYNRVAKYYDLINYPYEITDDVKNFEAEILDFDVKTFEYIHKNMDNTRIKLSGIEGFVEYDTANAPEEIGTILKMGEALQIGKHTGYGFGGFITINQEC